MRKPEVFDRLLTGVATGPAGEARQGFGLLGVLRRSVIGWDGTVPVLANHLATQHVA
jgi:hypothetical protein